MLLGHAYGFYEFINRTVRTSGVYTTNDDLSVPYSGRQKKYDLKYLIIVCASFLRAQREISLRVVKCKLRIGGIRTELGTSVRPNTRPTRTSYLHFRRLQGCFGRQVKLSFIERPYGGEIIAFERFPWPTTKGG